MQEFCELIVDSNLQTVYGVKGKSVLTTLSDFCQNVIIDYMHCVLLGVVRLLISLWFDSRHHKDPWFVD